MRKLFILLTAMVLCLVANAQTTKTIVWDNLERQYLEYVPSSYNAGTPAPVLFFFHGLGDNMDNAFTSFGFKAIADAHGWILIVPQAADFTFQNMPIPAWNSGISLSYGNNDIVVNEGIDDSGMMMFILDNLIATYSIDQNNVFCTGFSMGGFMSNRMAIEHGDRIKAIASVSGTIGNVISDAAPVGHVSAMHIHGTADQVVTYTDASYGNYVSVGMGAEATVEHWRNYNQCSATPTHTDYPDNVSDGLTFEKDLYEGGTDGTRTAFIKVTGGEHDWYRTPVNDLDYTTEIYNFFASCMGIDGIREDRGPMVNIYPNPTKDILHVEAENISNIQVYNSLGQIMNITTNTNIPVGSYSEGLYTVSVTFTDGRVLTRKVMVK